MMFVQKAIQTLLNDRDIKKSYNSELKAACETALQKIQESQENAANAK